MTKIALHELQIIDTQISRIEDEQSSLKEKQVLDMQLSEVNRLGKITTDLEEISRKEQGVQKSLEDEISVLSEKNTREEKKLYGGTITNPKELKGIADETKSLKARCDKKETLLLERIEKIEEIGVEQEKSNKLLQAARAATDVAQAAYEQVNGELDEKLHQLRVQREEVLKTVAPDTLKLYDRLRHQKKGLAVAQLDGSTCGGCHMELPAQEVVELVASEEVWRCPHCRRMLIRKT